MVVNRKTIDKLMSLGLSEYESKAYLSLLVSRGVTAYEAARTVGIPTSKIYEVLGRLEARGIVQSLEEEGKKKYIPLDSEQFIRAQKARIETTLDELETDLADIRGARDVSIIWNLKTYEILAENAIDLVGRAEKTILVSVWAEELRILKPFLDKAVLRGVKVALVHFGPPAERVGQLFAHPIEDTLYAEKGGRGFAMVVDGREALIATVSKDSAVEGAWSQNRGFATVAEDYVKHDIYIMKIVSRFDSLLIDTFGPNYARLRDIFSDTEEKK
jgi:sugar-specific transcriptional regulator TrmB